MILKEGKSPSKYITWHGLCKAVGSNPGLNLTCIMIYSLPPPQDHLYSHKGEINLTNQATECPRCT